MQPIKLNKNYKITKDGRLFSIKRKRFLLGAVKDTGYRMYCIRDEKKKRHFPTGHRLVAEAYIPNPENKPQVNHKDGDKLNNNLSNLEWCTPVENLLHAKYVLGKKVFFQHGEKHHNSKLNEEKVREIRSKYPKGGHTFRSLAKDYGVSTLVINQVIHNRTWIGV